ncbi:hypothetical protein GCM10020227_55410 [Streptomyces flavovirens]
MLRAQGGPRRAMQGFGCRAWMTFVADDAALATGGRRLSGDAIGYERQLGKPAAESDS